jgi:hypothetical protein
VLHRLLRSLMGVTATCLLLACESSPISPDTVRTATSTATTIPGDREPRVVFVISQGLFFDVAGVPQPLPMHGEFQLLINGRTEFGPGQPCFLGGRWWVDLNRDGIQNHGDHFFFSPLLSPGRKTP